MAWFPWARLDPNERLAAPILVRELGVFRALKVGRRIRRQLRAGEPFGHLPSPESPQERLSREQIGPAILLYKALKEVVDERAAWRISEQIVVVAACVFLRQSMGELKRSELAQMDDEARDRFAKDKGERFFNATVDWHEVSGERVYFEVTACRFPPLCAAAGVPELAPIFCKGDAKYFGTVEPGVRLERPYTIAEGAKTCPFTLTWSEGKVRRAGGEAASS